MAAVRPAGPEPMMRTFDSVGPLPLLALEGPRGARTGSVAKAIGWLARPTAPVSPEKSIAKPADGLSCAAFVPFEASLARIGVAFVPFPASVMPAEAVGALSAGRLGFSVMDLS